MRTQMSQSAVIFQLWLSPYSYLQTQEWQGSRYLQHPPELLKAAGFLGTERLTAICDHAGQLVTFQMIGAGA